MNIEIANRLVELRKKNGLSQEELADKLGLSRQAVSKWERAESSPDTDNLICLAKLYNVSLDELLQTSQDVDEIAENVKEKESEKENSIKELKEKLEEKRWANLSPEEQARYKKFSMFDHVFTGVLYFLAVATYFTVSFLVEGQWQKLWVIFLVPIVLSSIISCIKKRRFSPFAFPVLVALVYLTIGVYLNIWHPTWVMFIAVPLFYTLAGPLDIAIAEKRNEKVDPDDFDDEDEE